MKVIDARGMRCPWPALRLARALREHGAPIEIIADDPAAQREFRALAESAGLSLESIGSMRFLVGFETQINALFTLDR